MSLYGRIIGEDDPKIPVHQFMATIAERERGELDRDDIVSMFDLDAGETSELDDILDAQDATPAPKRFEFARMMHDTMLLSETGLKYTTSTEFYLRIETF